MPRILIQGALPADRYYVLDCKICKSVIEFQAKEGKLVGDRDGDFLRFQCPVCQCEMFGYGQGNAKPAGDKRSTWS